MITETLSPGASPFPPGMDEVFGCVRPVIFQFKNPDFSAVPGSGFLLDFFGEVFFITAKHVARSFSLENLVVPYSTQSNKCISFEETRTFSAVDPDDTDQVDIIVMRANKNKLKRELFTTGKPFDVSLRCIVTSFTPHMLLHFKGIAPEKNEFDYETGHHQLHYAGGDVTYDGPTTCRSIHKATAHVSTACPDFDGLSGSPLFSVEFPAHSSANANFAGMLIQGSRENLVLRFLEAERIVNYLLGFFIEGLSQADVYAQIQELMKRHFKLTDKDFE